ncbi:DUF4421 family protein [Marinigracilibium pacificum]|uniref:DUF4421 domain-containing protein n=1 Tax=Marinigracilibium pacificum TaxID=2729599 RepID=A0A848J593_9BACT|nr:DUF4421 family protein [Marinigracilibium pacificum]NMM49634.1 DUF4421 domain-containing protein [Marinigracilibium pacificum]
MRQLLVVFIFLSFIGYAQEEEDTIKSSRSQYVERFDEYLYVKGLLGNRSLNISLETDDQQTIQYRPNGNGLIGFGGYAFDLAFELTFRLPQKDDGKKAQTYGNTDYRDLQLNIYSNHFGIDFYHQKYKGFYISNADQINANWKNGDPHPRRSDLSVRNINVSGFWLQNGNKFSYKSSFNQTERQKESAGSFLVGASIGSIIVEADSAINTIPNNDFSPTVKYSGGKFTTLTFFPGYTHNFVWKELYLNMTLGAGAGLQWQKYPFDGKEVRNTQIRGAIRGRAAFGYNGDKIFTGTSVVFQNANANTRNVNLNVSSWNFKLFMGYRIPEFGIFKKKILPF